MPNAELAYKILDEIDAHPRSWDQSTWFGRRWWWRCGTTACFAGHACLLSGDTPDWEWIDGTTGRVITDKGRVKPVMSRAMELLDISWSQADRLFFSSHNRERLGRYVEAIFGPRPDPDPEGNES